MDAEAIENDADLESSYEQYPSPAQEYFPIKTKVTCAQVVSSFKADIPPVFEAKRRDFYTRNVVKQNKIHKIKHLTLRPEGAVPPNALNTWRDLTPDVKLPDIRDQTLGEIYYTRGKLGEKLIKSKPEFDLSDPVNKRKVMDTEKYSALHDPHCRGYFNRPSVMKHLKKQKLINNRKEVLCDVHEFNKYRSYLGELFNDQVKRRIENNNAMKDMERGLAKSLCAKQRRKEVDAHKEYQKKHREMHLAYGEAKRKRYVANIQVWKKRLQQIDNYRSQLKLATTGEYTVKHWNAFLTRQKGEYAEEVKKQHTLIRIAYAETKNDYVTKYDKFVRLALLERYKADQAAVMVARDDQIDDMYQLVDQTLKMARDSWLTKYSTFIQHCRDNPLSHYELVKAKTKQKYIMRKYFYKWIQYVLKQRDRRPDGSHQSVFEVEKRLRPFVNNLKELSPSDFEDDAKACGAGDQECKTRKLKKISKITNLIKMFPNVSKDANSKISLQLNTATMNITADPRESISPNTELRRKKRKKAKKQKEKEEADGNEADAEEPDDFIDKMVARYKLKQDQLKLRLKNVPSSHMFTLGNRYYVPNELSSVKTQLDDNQEEQKDTIAFLHDINGIVSAKDIKQGFKAMKL